MRKLFILETAARINRKPYLIQTIELCVPMPITKDTRQKFAVPTGRYLCYECLAVPCSDTGHPLFNRSRLIERYETKEDAIYQHGRVVAAVKKGAKIFGNGNGSD